MGKLKGWAYDLAEQTISDTIEKIIKYELNFEEATKQLREDNKVSAFFSNEERRGGWGGGSDRKNFLGRFIRYFIYSPTAPYLFYFSLPSSHLLPPLPYYFP